MVASIIQIDCYPPTAGTLAIGESKLNDRCVILLIFTRGEFVKLEADFVCPR
jgi:hypothetical protein